jgi:hypothetical protein
MADDPSAAANFCNKTCHKRTLLFDHLVGEQLHACINIMEESIAARWCAAG